MRKLILLCLLVFCSVLCGCSQSSQVEDQAYVLVMGLDRSKEGGIKMTVQIPRISGGSGESGSGGGKENYKQLSISAESFESALNRLSWAATRDPDLAQMKMIVISRELAEENSCKELIENIAQTERLYTATKIAVCEGNASRFVEAIQPNIGTRISSDIDSLFEHYNAEGYLPPSSLADLYYQTESIYSDPMVAYAILDEKHTIKDNPADQQAQPASAMYRNIQQISSGLESDNPTRYLGAAVFRNGRMVGTFNGEQTVMANLLRNQLDSLRYECDGQSLILVPTRAVRLRVDTNAQPTKITIDAKLSISAQEEKPNEDSLRTSLENDIRATIEAARAMKAEPFGFAEKAAQHFLTFDSWQSYNWQEQFLKAEIDIKLRFAYSDT